MEGQFDFRSFYIGQIEYYKKDLEYIKRDLAFIAGQLKYSTKEDREMQEWASRQTENVEWLRSHYGEGYKGEETRKLLRDRQRCYRRRKEAQEALAKYEARLAEMM